MSANRYALIEVADRSGWPGPWYGLIDRERPELKPVVSDFLSASLAHRLRGGALGENLVKAIGVKKSERAGVTVSDFTAGLGTDAFLLATAGFSVTAYERDPWIFQILESGWKRWVFANPEQSLSLRLVHGDAVTAAAQPPHAIVLDPMFEDEAINQKASPRKEMAVLRSYLSAQTGISGSPESLLQAALRLAENRVVVKRSDSAPALVIGSRRPTGCIRGKSVRYDIYSCR